LPLPFPRFFTPSKFTEAGLVQEKTTSDTPVKDNFLLSLPIATRLAHDTAYLPQVENSYSRLRNMGGGLRNQLLRDDNFLEEEDLRDLMENLANLVEDFRSI
jgi:hypothetical protein